MNCVKGAVLDVAVDIRKGSSIFGHYPEPDGGISIKDESLRIDGCITIKRR